ncbi:MAG: hypothetical protein U5J64_09960 [Halobacteriales archaeon]|nr:hypothetical protein [Halobacteriales archaeon]
MSKEKKTESGTENETEPQQETETETDEAGPRYTEDDVPPAGAGSWTPTFLAEVRGKPKQRGVLLIVDALVGVGFAWFHWFGLFVAGALVGLVSETVPRALFAGFVVGVLVLVLHVGVSPVMDAGEFFALSPPSYVAIAAALLMPLWGSLIRGVV